MADKLQQTISAFLTFVDGERPSAAKFNALIAQIRGATRTYEYAIGDILSQNWPYTTNPPNESFTYLTIPYGRRKNADIKVDNATSAGRPLDIINLARIIGPSGNLNPSAVGGFKTIREELIPSGGSQYSLRYPPQPGDFTENANVYFKTNEADINVEDYFHFLPKANKSFIEKKGDWAHEDGILYWWAPKDNGLPSGIRVTYNTDPTTYAGGPNYQGATFNTIPDWHQVVQSGAGAPKLIIDGDGQINDGKYLVRLPEITHQQLNYNHTSTALTDELDLNSSEQLTLPKYLTDNFTIGEVIPAGLIVLKCYETNEVFREAIYIYDSPTTLYIDNIELCDMSDPESGAQIDRTYYLVTVGTDLTTSVDDLRNKLYKHSHNREFGEPLVSIWDIDEINKYQSISGYYPPSRIGGDFASQYLHKDGYRNDHPEYSAGDFPVLRGSLLVGLKDIQGFNIKTSTRKDGSIEGAEGEYSDVSDTDHSGTVPTYLSETFYEDNKPKLWTNKNHWIGESNRIVFGGLPSGGDSIKDLGPTSGSLPTESGEDLDDIISILLSRIGRGNIPFKATLNTSGPQIYRYKETLNTTVTDEPDTWPFKGSVEVFPIGSTGRITSCLRLNSSSSGRLVEDIVSNTGDRPNFTDSNLLDKEWLEYLGESSQDPVWSNKSFWNGALRIEGQKGYPVQIFADSEVRLDNTTYADTKNTYWVPQTPDGTIYNPTPPSRGKDIVLKSLDYIKMSANLALKCYARTNINFSAAGLVGNIGDETLLPKFHPDAGNFTATARNNIALQSGNNIVLQSTGDVVNKWDAYHTLGADEGEQDLSCNSNAVSEQEYVGGDIGLHAWKDICISAGSVGVEFNEKTKTLDDAGGKSGGEGEHPPFYQNLAAHEDSFMNQQAGSICLTARNPATDVEDQSWRKRFRGINILSQGPHEPRNPSNRIVIRTGPHAFKGTADLVGGYGYKYEDRSSLFGPGAEGESSFPFKRWENPVLYTGGEGTEPNTYPWNSWTGAYAGKKTISRYLDFSIHLIGHGGMKLNEHGESNPVEMLGTQEDLMGLFDSKYSYSSAGTLIMSSFWAKDNETNDAEESNETPPWGPTMPHSDDYNNFLAVTTNGIADGWQNINELHYAHKITSGLKGYQNLATDANGNFIPLDEDNILEMGGLDGVSYPSAFHTQRTLPTNKMLDAGIPCRSFWLGGWDLNGAFISEPEDYIHSQTDATALGFTPDWLNDRAGTLSAGATKPKRAELWVRNRSLHADEWTAVFDNSYGYVREGYEGRSEEMDVQNKDQNPGAFFNRKFGRWNASDYQWSGIPADSPICDAFKLDENDDPHVRYIPSMHYLASAWQGGSLKYEPGRNGAGRGVLIGAPNLMDVECAHVRYTWMCFRAANRSVGKIQSKGAYEKEIVLTTIETVKPTNPIYEKDSNGDNVLDENGAPIQAVDQDGPMWEKDGDGDVIGDKVDIEVPSHKVDWISYPDQYKTVDISDGGQTSSTRLYPSNYTYSKSLAWHPDNIFRRSMIQPPVDVLYENGVIRPRHDDYPELIKSEDLKIELLYGRAPNRFVNAQILTNLWQQAHGEWAVGQYSETTAHTGIEYMSFSEEERLDKLRFLLRNIIGIENPSKDQLFDFIANSANYYGYWSRSMINDLILEVQNFNWNMGPYILQHGHYGGAYDPIDAACKKKVPWWKVLIAVVLVVVAVVLVASGVGAGVLFGVGTAIGGWAGLGAGILWGSIAGGVAAIGMGVGGGFIADDILKEFENCQVWNIVEIENTPKNNVLACKGDVAYVSGAADYAEYIQIGEPEEWALDKDPSMFNWESGKSEDSPSFGLPEGLLVWIKEGKIWKYPDTGNETPMIITNRAAVVGNARAEFSGTPYELVSFIGQVPVRVTGKVRSGDLLIPSKNGRDVYGIPKEECDFTDYKKAIGTCWETMNSHKNTVLCAIGIK